MCPKTTLIYTHPKGLKIIIKFLMLSGKDSKISFAFEIDEG